VRKDDESIGTRKWNILFKLQSDVKKAKDLLKNLWRNPSEKWANFQVFLIARRIIQ